MAKKEELLDLDDVCPKAPEWAKGRHNILGWQDYDDEPIYQRCGFGCGWTRTIPPTAKRDFWGGIIDEWM